MLDLLKVFVPSPPKIAGGKTPIEHSGWKITVKYTTIADYLAIQDMAEGFEKDMEALELAKGTVNEVINKELYKWHEKYGSMYDLNDKEGIEDFTSMLEDYGLLASALTFESTAAPGTPQAKESFDDELLRILKIEDTELLKKVRTAIEDITPGMADKYETACTKCKTPIKATLAADDYFFDFR